MLIDMATLFRGSTIILVILTGLLLLRESLMQVSAEYSQSKKTKDKPPTSQPSQSETNIFNFFRLFVMRLIYGFASMIGADEAIEDFMGGILVPPGADDGDYKDYLDDNNDSDDYYK